MNDPVNQVNWRTKASDEVLLQRALMLKNIRAFFDGRGVIEVETPLLSQYSTTDPHLDSLQSCFRDQRCYLNTSPEYAMKRLLASWNRPVYQICKAFRDDELGPNHNPEFTMLEWYQPGYNLLQLMDEMMGLVDSLCDASPILTPDKGAEDDQSHRAPRFDRLSYQQAFEEFAGIDPHKVTSRQCYQLAKTKKVEVPQGLTVDDAVDEWLDWLLMQLVLPAFDKHRFTFLYDYPASQCALAKIGSNQQQSPVAKRFELFFGEVELANGFDELTDAEEQLQRFYQENEARGQRGKIPGRIDENLIAALQHGLPDCSGVAMGLDRLLMVLTNVTCIDKVMSFSWDHA